MGLLGVGAIAACFLRANPSLALLGGAAFALIIGNPQPKLTAKVQKYLLQISVVGLGFGVNVALVLKAGLNGLGVTAVSLLATVVIGWKLAQWLGLDRVTGQLITVGTGICGGSAIAVMGPVLGANEREMSVSLAAVFLLNALALLIFPIIGAWAGMDPATFGIWAALAIHDTSSVAGAAAHFGPAALAIAVTTKLARALWILPMAVGASLLQGKKSSAVSVPWFIFGFVAASALATFVPGSDAVTPLLTTAAKAGLSVTLFLIGTALTRETLRKVGWRPMVHAVVLWVLVAVGSFFAVRAFSVASPEAARAPAAAHSEGKTS